MKIKLIIVNTSSETYRDNELKYFLTSGNIDRWRYSSDESPKLIETIF